MIRELLNRYRPAMPDPEDTVMTSTEVLDHRLVVTRVHRLTSGGWMALSAQEAEESEPTWVHFAHVLEADPTVATVPPLKRGQYALRHPQLSRWTVFGPVGDLALDDMLDNGMIDRQHDALIARDHPR